MMNAPLQQVYLVSQPTGSTRHTGRDFAASGAVTGALTTTMLSGDPRGWFQCHTRALPAEAADLVACLVPGGPAYDPVREILTDMLASSHTGGGRRPRTMSGAELSSEAERILENRGYAACLVAVDGTPVSGVRFNSSPVAADETTALFLVVHDRHLVAIESHDGAGNPQALTRESPVTP
jgi:hypothetical protein